MPLPRARSWPFPVRLVVARVIEPVIFSLLCVRFLAAALLMAGLARLRRLPWPRGGRAWLRLVLFGLLNSGLYLGFSYEAASRMSVGDGYASVWVWEW